MKKEWTNAEIVELEVTATANIPVEDESFDELDNGLYMRHGKGQGSGSPEYYPVYGK